MANANELLKPYKEYIESQKDVSGDDVEIKKEPSSLVKVDYVDFHVMSIRKGVFEKMTMPWFSYEDTTKDITGDIMFCDKCKKSGVDIYVDLNLFVNCEKHIIY